MRLQTNFTRTSLPEQWYEFLSTIINNAIMFVYSLHFTKVISPGLHVL